nr:hypothetical protein CFP56_25316 [Quercus suber]
MFHNTHQQDPKLFPSLSPHQDTMASMIKKCIVSIVFSTSREKLDLLASRDPLIRSLLVKREATATMVRLDIEVTTRMVMARGGEEG